MWSTLFSSLCGQVERLKGQRHSVWTGKTSCFSTYLAEATVSWMGTDISLSFLNYSDTGVSHLQLKETRSLSPGPEMNCANPKTLPLWSHLGIEHSACQAEWGRGHRCHSYPVFTCPGRTHVLQCLPRGDQLKGAQSKQTNTPGKLPLAACLPLTST